MEISKYLSDSARQTIKAAVKEAGGNEVFFTGDINSHSDSEIIKDFIYKKGLRIESLTDEDLYDIGGFVVV